MTLFAIVIPFRPKAESENWDAECHLLAGSIHTLLQQRYEHLRLFVVCTEMPEFRVKDQRVSYHSFPYGHQPYDEIKNSEDLLSRFNSKKLVVARWDKARKICYGSLLAKEAGANYIMGMDADDRISNKLFEYLASQSQNNYADGWYAEKGYLYKENKNYLIRLPKNMRNLNGSTHILRADLVQIPDFNSLDWLDYSLFTDHGWVKDRVREYQGAVLEAVPFPFVVYYIHRSNISQIRKKEYAVNYKTIFKRFLRSVKLTTALRNEFGLYAAQAKTVLTFSLLF